MADYGGIRPTVYYNPQEDPKIVEKEPLPDIYTLREKKESKDVVK